MKRLIAAMAFALALVPASAWAADFEAVPKAWRIQDSKDGGVTAYYTPSPCVNGAVVLPSWEAEAVKQRFWSLLNAAKLAGKVVGIYYTVSGGSCIVDNFYLKEQ